MLAQLLNENCQCITSDRAKLAAQLSDSRQRSDADRLRTATQLATAAHPSDCSSPAAGVDVETLFAQFPVFVSNQALDQMQALVSAVQRVARNPRFEAQALASAPMIAQVNQGTHGILYGYDFHISAEGPRLIEINTNAGGALLNSALAKAQQPCCDAVQPLLDGQPSCGTLEENLVQGFRQEFKLARGAEAVLQRVAIVDERPSEQFLYSEFLLFADLLRAQGIEALIADPRQLEHRDGALWVAEQRIDLVYNRLTDFYLEGDSVAALRTAYLDNAVVVTPHPRGHALFANKQHLALLSDPTALQELGVDAATIATLTEMVPKAEVVRPEERERLFRERKRLFFKPLTGYAGKGAYRGDKLTHKKFDELMTEPYVAQNIVAPSERWITHDGGLHKLKLDVRAYVVSQQVVLFGARLYQGQTTNFRTPGGGFAAVLATPAGL